MEIQSISKTAISANADAHQIYNAVVQQLKDLVNGRCRIGCCPSEGTDSETAPDFAQLLLNNLATMRDQIDHAVALEPSYAGFYIARAEIAFILGDANGAFESLSEAIRLNPKFSDQYYQAHEMYVFHMLCHKYRQFFDTVMVEDMNQLAELTVGIEWVQELLACRVMIMREMFPESSSDSFSWDSSSVSTW